MSQRISRQDSALFGLSIELFFPSEKEAKVISGAIMPEFGAKHLKRSRTSMGIKNRIISINIKAVDAVALRATANSCLNSIILTRNILEV